MKRWYHVWVSHIGKVYDGPDDKEALETYRIYEEQARDGFGRASGECVTLLENDEPVKEFHGEEH